MRKLGITISALFVFCSVFTLPIQSSTIETPEEVTIETPEEVTVKILDGLFSVKQGIYTYYMDDKGEVKYREKIVNGKVTEAQEYYPGTIYKRDNIENGKKKTHIALNTNGTVWFRAAIDQNTQEWTQTEHYYDSLPWKYGYYYEGSISDIIFLDKGKVIKFMYSYPRGNTTPSSRTEFQPNTIFNQDHGSKITGKYTNDWTIIENSYKYYMYYTGEVRYREKIVNGKVTEAQEYYPGTIYKKDNIENGKKKMHIALNTNGTVWFRATIDKNTQEWTQTEHYHDSLPWKYGYYYEGSISDIIFLDKGKVIKFMYSYPRGSTTPSSRTEFQPNAIFNQNHGSKITGKYTNDWTITENSYKYYMYYTGEVKYREKIVNGKVTEAQEYYPGTIYKKNNIENGKKKTHIALNANGTVWFRATIDKNTQEWTQTEHYHDSLSWRYGYYYEGNRSDIIFLTKNKVITYAYQYDRGDPINPARKLTFQDGTVFNENHGDKVIKVENLVPHDSGAVWPVPGGGVTCGVGCYGGHLGVDIQVRKAPGDAINSIISGKVIETNNNCATTGSYGCGGGFGNYVIIHGVRNGVNYVIMYAHMQRDSLQVQVGSQVQSGQKIGGIGDSGSSEGYHVHIEVLKGRSTWTSYKGPGGREGIDFRREFGV